MTILKFCGRAYKSTDKISSKDFAEIIRNGLRNDALSFEKQKEIYDFCRRFDKHFLAHLDLVKAGRRTA